MHRSPRRGRARKGASALIAGALFVAILTTSLFSYYLTTGNLARAQAATLAERVTENAEQEAERFTVGTTLINNFLSAYAVNDGPVPVEIAYLLVVNATDRQVLGLNNTAALAVPIVANPGKASPVVVSDFAWPAEGSYEVRMVSERGTVARGLFPEPNLPVFFGGIDLRVTGVLTIDVLSFNFTQRIGAGAWADWEEGFEVRRNRDLVWRVEVTNHDPVRDLYLSSRTQLFLVQAESSAILEFFMVRATLENCADPYTNPCNTRLLSISGYDSAPPLVIPANTARWVYFSATMEGGSTPNRIQFAGVQFANFILLEGNWNGVGADPYGQNIPVTAVVSVP